MTSKNNDRCRIFYGDSLYSQDKPAPYIIEGFLYEGDHMLIHAKKGVGKSVTGMEILSAVTTGRPFLNVYPVNKICNVIWLQGESTHSKYDERIRNMKRAVEIDDSKRIFVNCKRIALNKEKDLYELLSVIAKPQIKYDLFIIDSLYNFVSGTKNSDDVATDWIKNVDYMLSIYNASCISLGHTGKDSYFQIEGGKEVISKGSSAKGAVEWDAAFTTIYELQEVDKNKHILQLLKHKDRDGNCIDHVKYRMIVPQKDAKGRLMLVVEDNEMNTNKDKIIRCLRGVGKPLTINDICEEANIPISSFYYAIKDAMKTKMIGEGLDEFGRKTYNFVFPT